MSAAEICLQDATIVEKILEHHSSVFLGTSQDSLKNLKLRLVNKSFNAVVLRQVRRAHRNIRMMVPGAPDYRRVTCDFLSTDITMNLHQCNSVTIFDFIRFLREVVKVRIEHLEMINFWATVSDEEWRRRLHDEIHTLLEPSKSSIGDAVMSRTPPDSLKTFVGMRDVCDGCEMCYALLRHSSVYGPYQTRITDISNSYQDHIHFKKLIIDERLLDYIASSDIWSSEEDQKKFVSPHLSCDQLCIRTCDGYYISDLQVFSQPLPVEIIDEMCNVWKAVSIEMKLGGLPMKEANWEVWSERGMFTPLWLEKQPTDRRSDKRSDKKKLSSVTIDMQDTREIYAQVIGGSCTDSYSNLITNVRMLFPTDNIIIIGDTFTARCRGFELSRRTFENILKSVWKMKGHLEMTIRHFVHSEYLDTDFSFPASIDIMGQRLNCTLLSGTLDSAISRTLRISDLIGEKTLNLELAALKRHLESGRS